MSKRKATGLIQIYYTLGTLVIAVMVIIMAINFTSDARLLQKPLLSSPVVKQDETGDADGFKTIKFKKPETDASKKSDKSKTGTKPASTAKTPAKPPAQTPAKTPDP